jgi:MFS family permease
VTAFKGIFTMSTFEASLVQFAYFGAYFCLALPTAFLNERFGYKVGVLTGLGLAAIGAFGFYPAAKSLTFGVFLIALFILAAGLSVLEDLRQSVRHCDGSGGHRDQAAQSGAVVQPAWNQPRCPAGGRPRLAEDEPGHT